jgi:hypothetical protein
VWDVRLEGRTEIGSARSGIANQRDFAKAYNDFGKERLIETLPGRGKSRRRGRMSVANGVYVRPHAIEKDVHADFGGNPSLPLQMTTLEVNDDKVGRGHHAFVEAGGSGQNAVRIEADRQISLARDDVTALVEPAADLTDIQPVLLFRNWAKVG